MLTYSYCRGSGENFTFWRKKLHFSAVAAPTTGLSQAGAGPVGKKESLLKAAALSGLWRKVSSFFPVMTKGTFCPAKKRIFCPSFFSAAYWKSETMKKIEGIIFFIVNYDEIHFILCKNAIALTVLLTTPILNLKYSLKFKMSYHKSLEKFMRKSVMSLFATVGMVLLLAGCSDVIGNTSYESATVASSTMARTVVRLRLLLFRALLQKTLVFRGI